MCSTYYVVKNSAQKKKPGVSLGLDGVQHKPGVSL